MILSSRTRALTKPTGFWVCASCRYAAITAKRSLSSSAARPAYSEYRTKNLTFSHQDAAPQEAPVKNKYQHAGSQEFPTPPTYHFAQGSREGGKLPAYPARTRFAPSPTGYMHIGGLRTALFSYLLAKKTKGQFILRIEDTDRKRFVPGAEERLCEDLQWAGIHWDEGPEVGGKYGPYRQSDRTHIYQQYAKQLLDSNAAYRCFCTQQQQIEGNQQYTNSGCYQACSSLPADQAEERAVDDRVPFTVRLKAVPDVYRGNYPDLVHGKVVRLKRALGVVSEEAAGPASDTILLKSDGTPTYHFANVVDDHLMEITHVIRGSEWTSSLPLHYDLYTVFGWKPPLFAHVGLLVDEDRAKLSKRSSDGLNLDVGTLKGESGVLPETLCNFLALLGWSNPVQDDAMDMDLLTKRFDLKFTKGNTIVKLEKLWYLQTAHVVRRSTAAMKGNTLEPLEPLITPLKQEILSLYSASEIHTRGLPLESYIAEIILADTKAYQSPRQFANRNRHFFYFDRAQVPQESSPEPKPHLINAVDVHSFLTDFMRNFDFAQPYRSSRFTSPADETSINGRLMQRDFLNAANHHAAGQINKALTTSAWQALVKPESDAAFMDEIVYRSDAEQMDSVGLADFIAESWGRNGLVTGEMVAAQKKTWLRMVLQALRNRLCYGLHGPGMAHVMGILGWEECCRRMEIDIRGAKGKGW